MRPSPTLPSQARPLLARSLSTSLTLNAGRSDIELTLVVFHRSAASSTRQGPVDQLQSQVKPESSKTLGDKASDAMDTAASAVNPESNKTFGQKFGDTVNPDKYGTTVESDEYGHAETTGQKP
jgi:hypothetical protein